METEPIRTLIWGSCVSRDVVRVVPEPFELKGYIARQSWVSAFARPVAPPDLSHVASSFQARNLKGDFASNARPLIRRYSNDTDVLLIDIASDRHGVARYGGGYVSLTPDHRKAFSGVVPGGKRVPFADPRHLQLFEAAARQMAKGLTAAGLMEKALVLRVPFTGVTVTGETFQFGPEPAEAINAKYEPYYAVLAGTGFGILELPEELAVSDPSHVWGLGTDHYADAAYHWWAEQIIQRVRKRSTEG